MDARLPFQMTKSTVRRSMDRQYGGLLAYASLSLSFNCHCGQPLDVERWPSSHRSTCRRTNHCFHTQHVFKLLEIMVVRVESNVTMRLSHQYHKVPVNSVWAHSQDEFEHTRGSHEPYVQSHGALCSPTSGCLSRCTGCLELVSGHWMWQRDDRLLVHVSR